MLLRRITKHVTEQNWFAVFIDFLIVVVGVFIGIQVANWNEKQQDQQEQLVILELLESDIHSDIKLIESITGYQNIIKADYLFCLDVLARKIDVPKVEFDKRFATILGLPKFTQKRTSFENLVSSGKLELIENQKLTNLLIKYYNDEYEGWNTAMQDYTRNIIAPYLMEFDHLPLASYASEDVTKYIDEKFGLDANIRSSIDINEFDIKPKSLEDYRDNLFIINVLRYKNHTIDGQVTAYNSLLEQSKWLLEKISVEKQKIQ
jgi:hypothetical protein